MVLVTCILLAELALFTYIAMYHEQWQVLIKERLVSQAKKYNYESPSQYERALDYVQSKVKYEYKKKTEQLRKTTERNE